MTYPNTPLSPSSILGVYNATPPTYSDGNPTEIQTDANGNLKTTSGTQPLTDVSDTMTGSWRQLLEENANGHYGFIQNAGSNDMGVYLAPIGNGNTPPVPAGIGDEGVITLVPGGSIDLSEGGAPTNEIWLIGTSTDVATAFVVA